MQAHSEKIDLLIKALNRAQLKMQAILKSEINPFFKSHYAPLEAYIEAFQKFFSPEGLVFTQTGDIVEGRSFLSTTVWHESGQWIRSWYPLTPVKTDPQSMGAAYTYAKRYDLAGLTGMPTSDDDGESAMNRGVSHEPTQRTTAPSWTETQTVTDKQLKRLYAISKKANWSASDVKDYLSKIGLKESKELNPIQYNSLCNAIEKFPKNLENGVRDGL